MAKELQVFMKWVDFLKWLLDTTDKFPKKIRFTFTTRIDNIALDILENIIECRYNRGFRQAGLKKINLELEKLRVLLRICHELKYLSNHQYEFCAVHLNEVGKMKKHMSSL
jgi:hypothetical protein